MGALKPGSRPTLVKGKTLSMVASSRFQPLSDACTQPVVGVTGFEPATPCSQLILRTTKSLI